MAPPMRNVSEMMRLTLMPMRLAAAWSSATARMAVPIFVRLTSAHSAHSAQCPDEDARGANNGVPPGTVVIRNQAFNPAQINARVGKDVVWNFDDHGVAHTVTADNGSFDSGKRISGEFTLAFPQPGTYGYHCAVHPDMKGTVTVGRES